MNHRDPTQNTVMRILFNRLLMWPCGTQGTGWRLLQPLFYFFHHLKIWSFLFFCSLCEGDLHAVTPCFSPYGSRKPVRTCLPRRSSRVSLSPLALWPVSFALFLCGPRRGRKEREGTNTVVGVETAARDRRKVPPISATATTLWVLSSSLISWAILTFLVTLFSPKTVWCLSLLQLPA